MVLFPAFHFTKLEVTVKNQTAARGCPRSGSFQDWYQNPHPSKTFSQVCRDELMTLRYDSNPRLPMRKRFSDQRGVSVNIIDYGQTASRRSIARCTRRWRRTVTPPTRTSAWRATTPG